MTVTKAHRYFPCAAPPSPSCSQEEPVRLPRSLPPSGKPEQLLSQDDAPGPLRVPDPGDHQGLRISAPQKGTQEKERPEVP